MPGRQQVASQSTAPGLRSAARRTALVFLSGLALVSGIPVSTMAQDVPIARPSPRDPYADHIAEASRRFGVPIAWIRAVMRAESVGEPRAISPAGAMGVMQIMPTTWADLRVRHGFGEDPYDPRDNILAGTAYLRELHNRYGSPGFLAAYNAGPERYEESLSGRPLPAETRAYVAMLAPVIDGSGSIDPTTAVKVDESAWTRAPLFIAQSGHMSGTGSLAANWPADSAQAATTIRDVPAIEPRSNDLFVAHTSTGVQQ